VVVATKKRPTDTTKEDGDFQESGSKELGARGDHTNCWKSRGRELISGGLSFWPGGKLFQGGKKKERIEPEKPGRRDGDRSMAGPQIVDRKFNASTENKGKTRARLEQI